MLPLIVGTIFIGLATGAFAFAGAENYSGNLRRQRGKFFLINSNLQDTRTSVAIEATKFDFDIPVLIDEQQLVGESLLATRTAA